MAAACSPFYIVQAQVPVCLNDENDNNESHHGAYLLTVLVPPSNSPWVLLAIHEIPEQLMSSMEETLLC